MNKLIKVDDIFRGTAIPGISRNEDRSLPLCRVLKVYEDENHTDIMCLSTGAIAKHYRSGLYYKGWEYIGKYSKLIQLICLTS